MGQCQQHAPRSVYALADHLDTVLAACEDLLKIPVQTEPGHLICLELVAITHLLQARRHLDALRFEDGGLSDSAVLFLAGTAPLDLEQFGSSRPRCANGASTTTDSADASPAVTEDYLIGHQIPISIVAELTTGLLDALEYCYVLWDEAEMEGTLLPSSPGSPIDPLTTSNAI